MTERPYAAPVTRLNDLLIEVGVWIDSRFPDDTIERRGLILAEETGEIVRCILKAAQQIRGGSDHWNDQLPDEVGDGLISLLGICHRAGIDVDQAIALRWREVRQRTYPTTHSDQSRCLHGEAGRHVMESGTGTGYVCPGPAQSDQQGQS